MKKIQHVLMLLAIASLTVFISCGGGGDDEGETQKEKILSALTAGTWSVDATATDVDNVSGTLDVATFTITFSETAEGATFTLGGDVDDYLSGGSFAISEEGAISNIVVNTPSADLSVSASNVVINSELTTATVTVTTTEAGERTGGLGTYTLVFKAA